MKKVSIIVPVYNVELYIEKCLESLVNQTLEEIEIIIVNDGSKDNSKKIINKYIEKYPNKIVYLEKENGGLSDARNYGIQYATGEYIAFLDSDDYVKTDTYEKMYNKAKNDNADLVECDFYWSYKNKNKEDIGFRYTNDKKEMIEKIRVVAWNKLIKKEIIVDNNLKFPKGLRYEDVEFTYKLILYINKVSFIEEPMIYYVQRDNSISKVQNDRTKEIFSVLENVIDYYKSNGFYKEYKTVLEYIYVRYIFCSSLLRMVKIKDKKIRQDLLEYSWNTVYAKFPNWKKNEILNNNKTIKNLYLKSINKITYKMHCNILK